MTTNFLILLIMFFVSILGLIISTLKKVVDMQFVFGWLFVASGLSLAILLS